MNGNLSTEQQYLIGPLIFVSLVATVFDRSFNISEFSSNSV